MTKNSVSLHISGTNCTSYDCVFWYTVVKWWYLQQFFSFFQKSNFSGFSKFINDWQKEILRCAPSFFTCVCVYGHLVDFMHLYFNEWYDEWRIGCSVKRLKRTTINCLREMAFSYVCDRAWVNLVSGAILI